MEIYFHIGDLGFAPRFVEGQQCKIYTANLPAMFGESDQICACPAANVDSTPGRMLIDELEKLGWRNATIPRWAAEVEQVADQWIHGEKYGKSVALAFLDNDIPHFDNLTVFSYNHAVCFTSQKKKGPIRWKSIPLSLSAMSP